MSASLQAGGTTLWPGLGLLRRRRPFTAYLEPSALPAAPAAVDDLALVLASAAPTDPTAPLRIALISCSPDQACASDTALRLALRAAIQRASCLLIADAPGAPPSQPAAPVADVFNRRLAHQGFAGYVAASMAGTLPPYEALIADVQCPPPALPARLACLAGFATIAVVRAGHTSQACLQACLQAAAAAGLAARGVVIEHAAAGQLR